MTTGEILDTLLNKARHDDALRDRFLATEGSEHALRDFCAVCTGEGYPLYEMDILSAGEDYYAAMRRSTNGGGENSPLLQGEDDYYEMFLNELKNI